MGLQVNFVSESSSSCLEFICFWESLCQFFSLPFHCLPVIKDIACIDFLRLFIRSRVYIVWLSYVSFPQSLTPLCAWLCFKVAAWPWCLLSPLLRPTMELCMSWMLSQPNSRLNTNTAIISSFSGPGLASVKKSVFVSSEWSRELITPNSVIKNIPRKHGRGVLLCACSKILRNIPPSIGVLILGA